MYQGVMGKSRMAIQFREEVCSTWDEEYRLALIRMKSLNRKY